MNKAYRYRMDPTIEQETVIRKTFGCVRFIYNQMLAERRSMYELYKDNKEQLKQQRYRTPAGFKTEFDYARNGMFRSFLGYKLADRGKPLVRIDKWFPSSRLCRACGTINTELTLKDRVWSCDGCGTTHHRDENAARNIQAEGINMLGIA